ncbi:hypothetical protein [Bordetella hinzii]|uniref:hypothetical protein n=1 Tax=Bordetella hinzii TaxID=103855 RepID=UPI00114F31DE|nr:hypothetical protein [Bordetella hinzii]QDJ40330.1 hypothetical protein CBR70_02980 [Bordetella hinzii]
MNEQNSAVQPLLTGDEIRAAVRQAHSMTAPSDTTEPGDYVMAGVRALLSKLRAPVADETQALHDHDLWFQEYGQTLGAFHNSLTIHTRAAWVAASRQYAALASAPVASPDPVAKDWNAINAAIDEYLDGYELRGEPGDHTPTEFERFLILDAINGLLADEEFLALLSAPPAEGESAPVAGEAYQVRCGACGCESKATTPPDGAIGAWNHRTVAAPQASAETAIIGLSERDRHHVREFINCDGLGSMVVEGPRYSAVVRALKTQADKDRGQQRAGDVVEVCPDCDIAGCQHIRASAALSATQAEQGERDAN